MWLKFKRNISSASDEDLVRQYRRDGDTGALATLYQRYVELLYGVCMKYLRQEEDAKEAVIGIFEHLMDKLPGQEVETFKPWLYVVAKNYCLGVLRKSKKHLEQKSELIIMHSGEDSHHLYRNELEEIEQREGQLRECIQSLPGKQKLAIELFYFEKKSYEEIAEKLQAPGDRIRSYMQNGRRNLKLCLEKKNGKQE